MCSLGSLRFNKYHFVAYLVLFISLLITNTNPSPKLDCFSANPRHFISLEIFQNASLKNDSFFKQNSKVTITLNINS